MNKVLTQRGINYSFLILLSFVFLFSFQINLVQAGSPVQNPDTCTFWDDVLDIFYEADCGSQYVGLTIRKTADTQFVKYKCDGLECQYFNVSIEETGSNYIYTFYPKNKTYWTSSDWATLSPIAKVYTSELSSGNLNKLERSGELIINSTGNGGNTKVYSVSLVTSKDVKWFQLGDNSQVDILQNQSTVQYQDIESGLEINNTLKKYNGEEYVIAPDEIFVRQTANDLKFGANDTYATNDTEYVYELNSNKPMQYFEESKWIVNIKDSDYQIVDFADVCSYDGCSFNYTEDRNYYNTSYPYDWFNETSNETIVLNDTVEEYDFLSSKLEVYFTGEFINTTNYTGIIIDPSYTVVPNSNLSFNQTRFESSSNIHLEINDIGNRYAVLDGAGDYISISDSSSLSFAVTGDDYPFSGSAWVNFNGDGAVICKDLASGFGTDREWCFRIISSKIYMYMLDDDTTGYMGRIYNTALNTGQWYHIAFTYDGSESSSGIDIYVNGTAVDDTDYNGGIYTSMEDTSQQVDLGKVASVYLNSSIDEVMLFNKELNPTEINEIYDLNRSVYNYSYNNLVAYYPFDNFSDEYEDYTKENNDGTKNGDVYTIQDSSLSTNVYNDLLAYYPFDADDGTTAYDLTNNNNDGSYAGTAVSNSTSGIYGDGLWLDGNSDYIDMGTDLDSLLENTNISISAWVKTENTGATLMTIISNYVTTGSKGINAQYQPSTDTLYWGWGGAADEITTVTADINDGAWHHLIFTRNATTTANIYLDGTHIKTDDTLVSEIAGSNLWIGRINAGLGRYWDGSIDEVMIFSTALNQTQISDIYNNQSSRFKSPGTIGYQTLILDDGDNVGKILLDSGLENQSSTLEGRVGEWQKSEGYISNPYNNTAYGEFEGYQDYITIDTSIDTHLENLDDFTACAWYKPKGTAETNAVLFGAASIAFPSINNRNANGLVWASVMDNKVGSTTTLTLNEWSHLCFVKNSTHFWLTDDTAVVGTPTASTATTTTMATALHLGWYGSPTTGRFANGSIDEYVFFNKTLNTTEISDIYNLNRTIEYNGSTDNLVAYYSFNNITSQDNSGNGHDGIGYGDVHVRSKTPPANSLLEGLNGYWSADGNLIDYSGRMRNGIATADANASTVGIYNNSFGFDGTGDYIIFSDGLDDTITITQPYAMATWVKLNTVASSQSIFENYAGSTDRNGIVFLLSSSSIHCGYYSPYTSKRHTGILADTWYHVVYNYYEDGAIDCYLNGIASTDSSSTSLSSNANLGYGSNTGYLNGFIDEPAVWNRTLSQEEVTRLYNEGLVDWSYYDYEEITPGTNLSFILTEGTENIRADLRLNATPTTNWYTPYVTGNLTLFGDIIYQPEIIDLEFYALDSNQALIGVDSNSFNTSNLEEIEYMQMNFTLQDLDGISSQNNNISFYYTANGSNACAPGNKQNNICFNYTSDTWVYYQNGTDQTYFIDEGNQGDYIDCSYTVVNSTHRDYTCLIDEHYNPNIMKWYSAGYDYSNVTWQTAYPITKNNQIKIDMQSGIVPLTADQYKLDFRVNYTSGVLEPSQPLEAYGCNTSYTTGDAATSQNCILIASKLPSELQDDGTKFRGIFTSDLVETLGASAYIILTSPEQNPARYYYIKTIEKTNATHTIKWEYSSDSGSSWGTTDPNFETEMNINWFYDGVSPTEVDFKIPIYDDVFAATNSSEYNMTWDIDATNNYPPLISILNPVDNETISAPATYDINWSVSEPNLDTYIQNLTLTNTTGTYFLLTNEPNGTLGYSWDNSLFTQGEYNLTLKVCEDATADLFCKNETHKIHLVYDTLVPWIEFISPTQANATMHGEAQYEIYTNQTDLNPKNVTYYWYYQNGTLIDSQAVTWSTSGETLNWNFTAPTSGQYYLYNATACDIYDNCNSTETRWINIDFEFDFLDLILPLHENLYSSIYVPLKYFASDNSGVDTVWYNVRYSSNGTNSTYISNTTVTGNTTITITDIGSYFLDLWANDTAGNVAGVFDRLFDVTNVSVGPTGPQGPQGPQGPGGPSSTTFINTCRYKKLAYYNENLAWARESNCI